MSRLRWLLLAAALVPGVAGAAATTQVHYVMGTWLRITADEPAARPAVDACFAAATRLDDVFSRWRADSELERLHARGGAPTTVGADFAALLARGLALRTATDGAFDPTVGALTALWRAPEKPTPRAVAVARAHTGPHVVRLRGRTVRLAPGARLDFDGIAKGFVVDRCITGLRAAGATRALVSFGESSIAAIGHPPDADAWPLDVRGVVPDTVVGRLRLRDATLSVSAVRPDGGRAHIVDPRSGRLLADDAVAVVVAPSATDAEAWSKAVLVGGPASVARAEARGGVAVLYVGAGGARQGPRLARAGLFAPLTAPRRLAAAEEPLR